MRKSWAVSSLNSWLGVLRSSRTRPVGFASAARVPVGLALVLLIAAGCGGGKAGPECGNAELEGVELCDDGTMAGTLGAGPCTGECTWQEWSPGGGESAMYPSVAMNAVGDYVLAWRGVVAADDEDVWAAAYSAGGLLTVPPFAVNLRRGGNQQYPSVGIDDQGRFVVAWQTDPQSMGAEDGNVWLRAFDAAGAPLTGDVQLNTWSDDRQSKPSLALNGQGALVVAWTSAGQDGDLTGVYARLGDAAGQLDPAEPFQVNTEVVNLQENPAVGLSPDGRFVVAWESRGQEST